MEVGPRIIIFIVVGLLIAAVVASVVIWAKSPSGSLVPEAYIWQVGNGVDPAFVTSAPVEWPFVVSGNKVAVTYTFELISHTYTHPTLPILLLLPSNAVNLNATVNVYVGEFPAGNTGVTAIQHSHNTLAFQFQPSGTLITWNFLTVSAQNMTFIVFVTYTIA